MALVVEQPPAAKVMVDFAFSLECAPHRAEIIEYVIFVSLGVGMNQEVTTKISVGPTHEFDDEGSPIHATENVNAGKRRDVQEFNARAFQALRTDEQSGVGHGSGRIALSFA